MSHKTKIIVTGGGGSYSILEASNLFGGTITYTPPRVEILDSLADISRANNLLGWAPKKSLISGTAQLKN